MYEELGLSTLSDFAQDKRHTIPPLHLLVLYHDSWVCGLVWFGLRGLEQQSAPGQPLIGALTGITFVDLGLMEPFLDLAYGAWKSWSKLM